MTDQNNNQKVAQAEVSAEDAASAMFEHTEDSAAPEVVSLEDNASTAAVSAEETASAAAAIAENFDESINLESPHSIGVDIVEIDRMRAILERTPSFKTRVFSEAERAYCEKTARPECHYATRFAAKEAVLKALGTGFSEGIGVRDIEVVHNSKGKPQVKLYNKAAEKARTLQIKDIPLSLSYTQNDAVACVLALVREVEQAPEKEDPTAELHRQFKEVRSMLDSL